MLERSHRCVRASHQFESNLSSTDLEQTPSNLAGKPDTCRKYDELRRRSQRLNMATDVQTHVTSCKSCRRHISFQMQQRLVQLFLPSPFLDFLAN